MKKNMLYNNNFLGVRTKPSKDWQLTSYQTATIKKSWKTIYQLSEDDLPTKNNHMKRILDFTRFQQNSTCTIDAEIELCILYQEKGVYENENFVLHHIDKTFIGRVEKDEVRGYKWFFATTPFEGDLFFYVKIAIFKPDIETETMSVFNTIRFT
jgi:hypothetical protein